MGYALRREIRDVLPRGGVLTPSEWRLILELADWCNDTTRSGKPGVERLAQFTDMPDPRKVGEMFASIAKKWVELRLPLGLGKDGRPYYSRPRANTEYHFPEKAKLIALVKAPSDQGPSEAPEFGGPKAPGSGGAEAPQFRDDQAVRPPKSGEQSPQGSSPQKDPSSLSPRDPDGPPVGAASERERDSASPTSTPRTKIEALGRFGVDPDEAAKLIPIIERDNDVRNFGFYVHTTANGTLADCIRLARAALGGSSRFTVGPDGYAADSREHGRWCGQCDQRDRMLSVGTTSYPKEVPCPTCHRDRPIGRPVEGWSTTGYDSRRTSTRDDLGDWFGGRQGNRLRGQDTRDGSIDWDDPGLMEFK